MKRRFFILFALGQVAAAAFGQQIVTFQFSFSNPGARSLGFGGAFVALADDATAAYANPAGLVQLAEPEVSIEGRFWSYSTPFTAGGRAQGIPTGLGLDTTPGLRERESEVDLSGLSFLSAVYPKRRWSIAFYRHLLSKFESSVETQGLFADGPGPAGTARFHDQQGFSRTEIVNYGVSAGFRVNDSLSLGLGASYMDIEHFRHGAAYLPDDDSLESFFGEVSFLPERRLWEDSYVGDSSGEALNVGFLWRGGDRWSLGGVWRSDFKHEVDTERRLGPAQAPDLLGPWKFKFTQGFPSVFGLGVAYRSSDGRLTSSLEWDHRSEMMEADPDEAVPAVNEIHLGGEYAFLRSKPLVALRVGVWLDPDHRVRATRGDPFFRARLRPGQDEIHFATGIGLRLQTLQIDFGIDVSDLVDTASLSLIYSF